MRRVCLLLVLCVVASPAGGAVFLAPLTREADPEDRTPAASEDVWRAGLDRPAWEKVTRIQRYPLWDEPEPDWAAMAEDGHPLVRAATAIALARLKNPAGRLNLLDKLLEDEKPLPRQAALWTLLRIKSPKIKKPLLKVLRTWEEIPEWPYEINLFTRLGLPRHLAVRSRPARRRRLKDFDVEAWNPAGGEEQWPGSGRWRLLVCPAVSQQDAGQPLPVRIKISRLTPPPQERDPFVDARTLRLRRLIDEWRRLEDSSSRIRSGLRVDVRRDGEYLLVPKLLPGESFETEAALSVGEASSLPPAVYKLSVRERSRPIFVYPLFLRARRAPAFEKRIPRLVRKIADWPDKEAGEAVQKLAEQRVKAAGPALLDAFREDPGFALAEALGRIRYEPAIPALLDHPNLRDFDLIGTTAGALEKFGERGDPHYEKRILNWRKMLRRDAKINEAGKEHRGEDLRKTFRKMGWIKGSSDPSTTLHIALRLLGSRGSPAADEARLAMLRELPRREDPPLRLLSGAALAMSSSHPERVVRAIWRTRDQKYWFILVRPFGNQPSKAAGNILGGLWNRLAKNPDALSEDHRDELMRTSFQIGAIFTFSQPEALRITSEEQAEDVVGHLDHLEEGELKTRAIQAVRSYLQEHPDSRVEPEFGEFLFQSGRLEEARDHFKAQRKKQDGAETKPRPDERAGAAKALYYLAHFQLADGDLNKAEKELRRAERWLKSGRGGGRRDLRDVQQLLGYVRAIPRRPNLSIRSMKTPRISLDQFAHGRVFSRSGAGRGIPDEPDDRLKIWEPASRRRFQIGPLPRPILHFAPLDRRRVVVVCGDGKRHSSATVALYEIGRGEPLWKKTIPRAGQVRVLSEKVILLKRTDVLRALDPATGETMWTRREPKRYLANYFQRVRADGGILMIEKKPHRKSTVLQGVNPESGKALWEYEPPDPSVRRLSVGRGVAIISTPTPSDIPPEEWKEEGMKPVGRITAIDLSTGEELWRRRQRVPAGGFDASRDRKGLGAALPIAGFAIGPDDRLYTAIGGRVEAIRLTDGRELWRWRWVSPEGKNLTPERSADPWPDPLPAADGVYCVLGPHVVFLSKTGEPLLHATSALDDGPETRRQKIDTYRIENGVILVGAGQYNHAARWETWRYRPEK